MSAAFDSLRDWIGRTQSERETVSPRLAAQLAALLDHEATLEPGDALPPLWHWALFPAIARQSHVGVDGHPTRGGFLPPVPLPRRMWAGSRVQFERPVRIGHEVTRTSQIVDVGAKEGRSGQLVFVRVRHQLEDVEGGLLSEEQDIVYRDAPRVPSSPDGGIDAPGDGTWRRLIVPDPVLLFRYSAVTYNGHRIHYDRPYATEQEGYPALVVHGPLTATLLVDLVRRNLPRAPIAGFSFKAIGPLFDNEPFYVCATHDPASPEIHIWAESARGRLCVDGRVTLTEAHPATGN
ncbi:MULTISPECIES: MaoC family dehydratase N-terminal domain-containing protein [Burkholderia]|uniref:Acyl-CoA dehydrogenase n=2 Tax=Burkholderia TaxID=32008 RepID=A0A6J5JUJ3_9BURK|nr:MULTISPECIES: MaoC family dehydratase N-terminal domain-containing protein [Burkholderia]AYQ44068.1 acyl-CoA dehydrogenase [Burkholderia lata]UKD17756.1 MaoC family dehydratase N-terminal domain-containing protein [Burkholderia aenigmatica]CAB3974715.1 acyl-CoA dehydrogenase [Burkholderia aenigmatica]